MSLLYKSVEYLRKYGLKRTLKHTKDYIEMLQGKRPAQMMHDDQGMLNGYEYKYYRYLRQRMKQFDVSFETFRVNQIDDLVSVVLPVFNGDDMIEDSIKSVIKQTYKNFELIIIDDGSTDNTPQLVDKWAKKDKRIRVIHQKNSKLPRALNNGFRLARGEFLTWTSADNNMHPDFLEKLVGFMKQKPGIAMCYANLRAIDGEGKPIINSTWYSRDEGTGNVYLPDAALRLNTYPENTVAAAFMYRKAIPILLGGYDPELYTVEDYDYWMRINDFFSLHHTNFDDVIYDYRFHDKSLTSRAKELRINEMREKLMLMEDYRQDWIIRPMCWVFENEESAEKWNNIVTTAGHIKKLYKDMQELQLPALGSGIVQVSFSNGKNISPKTKLVQDALRVLVLEGSIPEKGLNAFDCVIQIAENFENVPQGVIRTLNHKTAFDLIQIFCKAKWFAKIIEENRRKEEAKLKATIVLCTYKRLEAATTALRSMVVQTYNPEKYEILVVNNDPDNRKVYDLAKQANQTSNCSIRYIDCPYSGLSAARNFSLYAAQGEIVLYVDDDGIMEPDCLEHLISAFDNHPEAAVIGGQIILKNPERFHDVILPGYEAIWSERKFKQKEFFFAEHDFDFPYGCNYAVRREKLRELGGFRIAYGRTGKDFAGGEEMVLSHLVKKEGSKVGIEPKAIIWHDVEASRYSLEHVKKTLRASRLTNHLMKMDLYKEYDLGMQEEKYALKSALEKLEVFQEKNVPETDLEYLYCKYDIEALKETIHAGENDYQIMENGRNLIRSI